jgi:hypothetical protein
VAYAGHVVNLPEDLVFLVARARREAALPAGPVDAQHMLSLCQNSISYQQWAKAGHPAEEAESDHAGI